MHFQLKEWLNRLERLITAITAVLMFFLTIIICYQVFARYVLNKSPYWVEETSVIGMMWVGLLGAAGCVWTDSHMNLGLFVSKLPKAIQVWIRSLTQIIIGIFAWFLLKQGSFLVNQLMGAASATIPVPLGYTYLILPISGGLMVLFAFFKAVKGLSEFYTGKGEK